MGLTESKEEPPFSLTQPRFDQSTFDGRVRHFREVTDWRTLLTTQEKLDNSLALLEQYKTGALPPNVSSSQLWEARKIKESIIHPDFNKPIPAYARMSAFTPANIPICGLLLWPTNNPYIIVGGQIINQTYNVIVNYGNRSASGEMSNSLLAGAYFGAVGTSCGIAYSFNKFAQSYQAKPNLSSAMRGFVRGFVPFVAVAMAGCVNVLMIRQNELTKGIAVFDEEGTQRGYSTAAGRNALAKCCLARILWNIPIMIFPPMVVSKLQTTALFKAKPLLRIPAELSVIYLMLWLFMPPSIAVFPQRDSLPVSDLEPQFQGLSDSRGRPVQKLFFNKGI